jgi:hypothetical protein
MTDVKLPKGVTRLKAAPVDYTKNPGSPHAPADLLAAAQVATARELVEKHGHTEEAAAAWLKATQAAK